MAGKLGFAVMLGSCFSSLPRGPERPSLLVVLPSIRQAEGDLRQRAGKHQELQLNADKLENMISWEVAKEPVMLCRMSRAEVLQIVTSPLKLPYACVHTQEV